MKHITVNMDFIPVREESMPRGREFLVLCRTREHGQSYGHAQGSSIPRERQLANTGLDLGHALIEKEPDAGPEGMVWHPSMSWNYDECGDIAITHWAEMPQIEQY